VITRVSIAAVLAIALLAAPAAAQPLPVGRYILMARVQVHNATGNVVDLTCNLSFAGSSGGISFGPAMGSVDATKRLNMTIPGTADVASGTGTITGNCGTLPTGVTATFLMTAVQVTALHP
jgi:hypothetical protein